MESVDLIRRLHQHRSWTNAQLLTAAAQLTGTQLHQTLKIGQGSVWRTLTHLYAAEYVWLEALLGNAETVAPGDITGQLPGNQQGEDRMASLVELRAHWEQLNQRWSACLETLGDTFLSEPIDKIASRSGIRSTTQCSDVLLHVCVHAQYTTAQLVNMLRQLGVDPLPDPMLITMARQQHGRNPVAES